MGYMSGQNGLWQRVPFHNCSTLHLVIVLYYSEANFKKLPSPQYSNITMYSIITTNYSVVRLTW